MRGWLVAVDQGPEQRPDCLASEAARTDFAGPTTAGFAGCSGCRIVVVRSREVGRDAATRGVVAGSGEVQFDAVRSLLRYRARSLELTHFHSKKDDLVVRKEKP